MGRKRDTRMAQKEKNRKGRKMKKQAYKTRQNKGFRTAWCTRQPMDMWQAQFAF